MVGSVRHEFVSEIADEPPSGRVRPSDWNAEHVVEGLEPALGNPETQGFLHSDSDGNRTWQDIPEGGITDHGALTGLADDDHPQYHTDARGDARYHTKTVQDATDAAQDAAIAAIPPGVTDHGALTGLGDDDHTQYHNDTRGDIRYHTKTVQNATDAAQDAALAAHIADPTDAHDASAISYVNTTSGLDAIEVQTAIDEVMASTGPSVSGFYRFDTVTTASDPGSGQLRYNHATPASVTALYVDTLSQPGTDATRLFGLLSVGMVLLIQQKNDAARFLQATISSTPTNNTGWWTIPVTVVASGTLPAAGASCNFVVLGGSEAFSGAAEDVSYDGTSSGLAADDVQAALDEVKGLIDSTGTPATSGSYLIAGGGVAWTGGLDFTVSAAAYVIQGTQYASPQSNVTLAAADATNPRIDVITINTSGAVQVITGTPAANPERPDVDPATNLEISFVYVPATATVVDVVVEPVYRENTEWTTSTSGGTFNAASTSNPFAGTKTVEGTSVANGHYVQFQKATTFDPATYNSLVFQLRSKATWPSQKSLTLTLRNAGTQRGASVVVKHGLYSFDSSITSGYQQIVIPAADFVANGLTSNQLRMTVTGGGSAIGMYIDNVEWQAGVTAPSQSDRMRWRGNFAAAAAYSTNDVVLSSGIQYVALTPSTGFTPASNPTRWQPSSAAGGSSTGLAPALFWALG